MQQPNEPERRKEQRRGRERDAAQAKGGQPRNGDDHDPLQEAEFVPSFLTASELQARDPAMDEERRREERRKNTLVARQREG